jgi:hypothetical protein
MLKHFIKVAASRVKSPIADTTGQSLHVDDYLGAANSEGRLRVANSISRIAERLDMAESRRSIDKLKQIFGDQA